MRHFLLTTMMILALTAPAFPHGSGGKGCCKGKDAKCECCAQMAKGGGAGCCKHQKSQQGSATPAEQPAPKK